MNLEKEFDQYLPDYRRSCIIGVGKIESGSVQIKAIIPRSVSCLKLPHASPTDATLAIMQAAYVIAGAQTSELPTRYQYQALFLGHQAQYLDQDRWTISLLCSSRSSRGGAINALGLSLEDPDILAVQLLGGIPTEKPVAVQENHQVHGQNMSNDQIAEILSIYDGEVQSKVLEFGFDSQSNTYEAVIEFPKYSEIANLEHVSAKQMIEAMMKTAYLAAGHRVQLGGLPISYQNLLDSRLDFRTKEHNIKYRKLLKQGSRSLLRLQMETKGNEGIVKFTHRPNSSKDEESFATGSMTFYLP